MAFFTKRAKGEIDPLALAQKNLEFLRDSCPAVFEALCGAVDAEGGWIVKPMTIGLYTENGLLMFRITSKFSDESFFGTVKNPSQLFDSIEFALATGEFKATVNKYSQSDLPH
jgi:hypothetical protein